MSNAMDCSSVNPIIQQIVDKGKRGAAEYIKTCRSPEILNHILDTILSHEVPVNDRESIEWIKWLIAGGETPDDFTAIVKKYNNATTCGLVWTAQFVAYRCRTCGISPCMSLCADCFQKGRHEGHDFNMFRSQAGGACDCGDTSVMRPSGFCGKHGVADNSDKMNPPPDLLYIANIMAPRIFLRLILHLRNYKRNTPQGMEMCAFEADEFLAMLSDFSGMGAAMRRVLTSALISPQAYHKATREWPRNNPSFTAFMSNCNKLYEEALQSLKNPPPPVEFPDCPGLQENLVHETFLEELVFWTVKYEFPQKVVCFLLNMLPDTIYKQKLTEAFVVHYSRIAMVLEKAVDPDTLSNRVVHVSVQLFSNEELAVRMTENLNLLQVMVVSLKNMMSRILIALPLNTRNPSYDCRERPHVVNCSLSVMNQHCYWPLVSDLNNVLSHRPVAIKFMENDTLTNMWFSFLSYFQGMNVNKRELNTHVEFEPSTYYAAFSAELEASAYPMWALLSHLTSKSTISYTKRMLHSCLTALKQWLDAVFESDCTEENQVSFHIPLHRYLATFICQAVNVQHLPLDEVLPQRDLMSIMLHPLRIQVAFYEIVNGLWVRNGLQIKGQAMTYIQCNFCSSMVDADLYLLQIVATQLPAVTFLTTAIEKFHILEWLSFFISADQSIPSTDSDSEIPMVESFLQFLATLCSNRTNLGIEHYGSELKYPLLTRLEMITLLCVADRTHSQLMELMPERCGTGQSRDFEAILEQVAEFKPPISEVGGNMQQGLYIPKACVWEELYDPIHVLLRAVQNKKDFQNSTDRFTAYVKENKLLPSGKVPWPPFRIPRPCSAAYKDPRHILNSSLFHSIVWIVFYKYVHEKNVSEHVLSLAVYLLEMALSVASSSPASQEISQDVSPVDVVNLKLASWFPHEHIAVNVRTIIGTIATSSQEYMNAEDSDGFKWKSVPEYTNVYLAGRASMRHVLDTRNFVHDYENVMVATSSSAPLLPARNERESQPSSSNSPPPHMAEELVPDLVAIMSPRLLPIMPRKTCPTRRSSSVSIGATGASSSPDMKIYNANESIISLLLRTHSKLSGYHDSFNPDSIKQEELEVRIGDGPAFIGKVLTRIMMLDDACRNEVIACRERLWPKQQFKPDQDLKDAESIKLSDKKRRAQERQRKIMESFFFQQEEFAKNNLDVGSDDKMEWEGSDSSHSVAPIAQKQYDCGICSQTSPSTYDNPVGLVILLQATSVLGRKRRFPEKAVLPLSDKDRANALAIDTLAYDFSEKFKELENEFDQESLLQSLNFGWEGGVHVQTCGHHLHRECLSRYLQISKLNTDRNNGYFCPLCRQLATSVLPLTPDDFSSNSTHGQQNNLSKAIVDIANMIHNANAEPVKEEKSALIEAMRHVVLDMGNSTGPKYLHQHFSTDVFLTSVLRTNLEIEIVQRGGSLLKPKPVVPGTTPSSSLTSSSRENLSTIMAKKPACILPLLRVLASHARPLNTIPAWIMWQDLTGHLYVGHTLPDKDKHRIMPLLLRDPLALLIQFILILPLNMDQTYFTCIVKFLYNLLYFQVVAQLSCHLTERERNFFRRRCAETNSDLGENFTLYHTFKYTIESLDKVLLYNKNGSPTDSSDQEPTHENLESQIQELCLPFLRVAAVLRHHLYNQEVPEIEEAGDEFLRLVYYLELVSHGMDPSKFNSSVVFSRKEGSLDFVHFWFNQFLDYAGPSSSASRDFLTKLHIPWKQPKLLELPEQYDQIFQYYQRKVCNHCLQIPANGSICLVCGTLVCFKATCCKRDKVNEATQHAQECGAGTAMFLVVTSSYVFVLRGKRACIWGSVYLDAYGEEDIELKRGKTLYLSKERYTILERQWLTHNFDHTNKKWLAHADGL